MRKAQEKEGEKSQKIEVRGTTEEETKAEEEVTHETEEKVERKRAEDVTEKKVERVVERERAETRGGKTREKKRGGTIEVVVERTRKELERKIGVTVRLQTGETEEDGETLGVKGRTKSGKRRGWMK